MRQLALIATSILFAKSSLTTAEIGGYEMLIYLGTVLTFFWVNGLLQAMSPLFSKKNEAERKVFVFNVFIVFCGIAVLLSALLFLGQAWALPLLTGQRELMFFDLFCLYLLFNLPAFPVEYIYLLHNRPGHIVAWGLASFGLHVAALFLPLCLGFGLQGGFAGLAGLAFLRFSWALGLVFRLGEPAFDRATLHEYLHFSAPLMLATLTGNFVVMFDNWLVGWWFRDDAAFAIYRYGAKELPLAPALALALGTSLVPKLSENLEAGLAALKNSSRRLLHLLFPATILLMFFAKPLFPLVFNADFAASAPLFQVYLLITASRVLLPNSILLAKNAPRTIFQAGLIELFVKIVLGFVFIKYWGLMGLAWSAVLSYWLEKAVLIWILEQKFAVRSSDWLDVRLFGMYLLLLLLAFAAANI